MRNKLPAGWVEGRDEYYIRTTDYEWTICRIGVDHDRYEYELWKRREQIAVNLPSQEAAIREHSLILASIRSSSTQEAGEKSRASAEDGGQTSLSATG